jgi:hypothetical protein
VDLILTSLTLLLVFKQGRVLSDLGPLSRSQVFGHEFIPSLPSDFSYEIVSWSDPAVEVPTGSVDKGRYIVSSIGRPASLSHDLITLLGSVSL